MNAHLNEKSRDGDRGIHFKDSDGQASIKKNVIAVGTTKLLLMLSLIRLFKETARDYSLEADNPAWGVLEAADHVDAALDELIFVLECGGSS